MTAMALYTHENIQPYTSNEFFFMTCAALGYTIGHLSYNVAMQYGKAGPAQAMI